jgi:hypothetical protein
MVILETAAMMILRGASTRSPSATNAVCADASSTRRRGTVQYTFRRPLHGERKNHEHNRMNE